MTLHRSVLMTVSLFAFACQPTDAPELPDWSGGFPNNDPPTVAPTDTDPPLAGLVTIAPVLEFDGRFGLADDLEQPCAYDTTAGFGEIECRLEAEELDAFFEGWGYDVLVESGTCTYIGVSNYMYQAWGIGEGPPVVRYTIEANGNCIDEIGSQNCQPYCEFNYSTLDPSLPNCCYGQYTSIITVAGVQNVAPAQAWGGGDIGDCYDGAAYNSNITELAANGIPKPILFELEETVNNTVSVEFDGPIEGEYASNIPIANYLNSDDPIPVAFQGFYSRPDYVVECLDDAEETLARFILKVQDWDTVAEFESLEGDADIGAKPGPGKPAPLEGNGSGDQLNDRWDWHDFAIDEIDVVGFRD
ncbi:MAG: hypothetical protein AAGA48_15040 [Myxococcota bacterium]